MRFCFWENTRYPLKYRWYSGTEISGSRRLFESRESVAGTAYIIRLQVSIHFSRVPIPPIAWEGTY